MKFVSWCEFTSRFNSTLQFIFARGYSNVKDVNNDLST